ncbi:MAG: hypothetical protein K1X85_02910 [Ignavibacteria bacterium]|nr:hypothetical protein [Ignavibacteria bacterium]
MIIVSEILGREVMNVVKEGKTAEYNETQFSAEGLAGGVYFYLLSVRGTRESLLR